MAGIFTRKELSRILSNEDLTPEERTDQIFSLYGRALDDGYITRTAADAAQAAAIETARKEWEANAPKPNVLESDEYKELQQQFEGYKARQTARTSEEFSGIKPKFFDRVYDLIDRGEGAKPVADQLAELKKDYEEYFSEAAPAQQKPQFGAPTQGNMPKGEEGATAGFQNAWGFVPKAK